MTDELSRKKAFEARSKKLRFAIGEDDKPYSARWSVWAHNCNVYLLSKPIAHAAKMSLHGDQGSLVCQFGNTTTYYRERIADLPTAPERSFVRWKRKPTPERGLLQVVSIQFPSNHLRGKPVVGTTKKPLLLFSPGGPGTMVEIGVFYSRMLPEASEALLRRTSTPIGYFALPNGDNVSIAGRICKYEPPDLPSGEKLVGDTPVSINARHWNKEHIEAAVRDSKNGTFSMLAFNSPKDGEVLRVIEMGGLTLTQPQTTRG